MTEQDRQEAILAAQINAVMNMANQQNNLAAAQQKNAAYANQLYNMNSLQQSALRASDMKEMLRLDISHIMDKERGDLMVKLMDCDEDALMRLKLFLG